jgi:hypothetical protein
MAEGDIQDALHAIHSRLGNIEGKVNLIARSERGPLLAELEKVVRADPVLGQIYLVLDGERHQDDIVKYLGDLGISTSRPTVTRRVTKMELELGIAVLVRSGRSTVHRQDTEAEKVLALAANIRKWLDKVDEVVPPAPPTRRNRGSANA